MLIYSAIASLDGYVADAHDTFEWAAPDEEVHAFLNDRERPICTYLYGRRMYETMVPWEELDGGSPAGRDYAAIWRAADKVVYSTTLAEVSSSRTRLERTFDPEVVRGMKAEGDVSVGGANLAAQALAAGLVDEIQLYLAPVVVGGGNPALPGGVRMQLELLDERRFAGGFVYLRYRAS